MRIFISSAQKEFEDERRALGEFIAGDSLLSRQFDTFLFERDVHAGDRPPDDVYLDELAKSDLYLGLFGRQYGWENEEGLSPTHREFNEATRLKIPRLIYVQGSNDADKDPKMQELIRLAGDQLIRKRFQSFDDLRANVYASLVDHLESTGVIHSTPWDTTPAARATLDDIDPDKIRRFVRDARQGRGFPLGEDSDPAEILAKLNLLEGQIPTHGAILLFGRDPQRLLPSALVKCAQFHGTEVEKPIPAHLDVRGTAFNLVEDAVNFVLSRINVSVGTRTESAQAPVAYEIPREAVREAIVNAVAHRDYTSNASVQVSLFADRLEVWNPGNLPPALTLDLLRKKHGSFPRNIQLAEALYLVRVIERYGTGTGEIIRLCREAGLPEPGFQLTDGFLLTLYRPKSGPSGAQEAQAGTKSGPSWDQVGTKLALSGHQVSILRKCLTPSSIGDLMEIAGRSDRTKFRNQVLNPLLQADLLEMTIPNKPRSSNQQYRTTPAGHTLLDSLDQPSAPK